MAPRRRDLCRLAGVGIGTMLAGCLGPSDPGPGNDTADAIAVDTHPFVVHTSRPAWDFEAERGRVVLVDRGNRAEALFDSYDVSEEREEELREFLSDIDYEEERLLFVESAGPNACHDRLDVSDVRLEDDQLRADAAVIDTSGDDVACAEVVTHPSSLARVRFEEGHTPADSASVAVTDGWGETAMISATVDDSIGPGIAALDGAIRPDIEADPIEPLECDRDDVERYPQGFEEEDLAWGDVERDGEVVFGLRIDDIEFDYGDTAHIKLTNVSGETAETGNSAKYSLQAYTEDGWQDVRVGEADRPLVYTDEAIVHAPGEGFEWTFELTESGLEAEAFHDHAEVCPELSSGRYRFAFWGLDGAVAVAFDLTR